MTYPGPYFRIVVGVDDSAAAWAALGWAAQQARRTGAELVVLHAWGELPGCRAPYAPPPAPAEETAQRAAAEAVVAAAVAAVRDGCPEVPVRSVICRERAERALLRHSGTADLLVLGCRRPVDDARGYTGATLRSCLARAACPTVVVAPGQVGRVESPPPSDAYAAIGSPFEMTRPAYG
ncbi:hypothetical protein GCM10010517_64740 [Streptosporangium fragile]|uniref:UspA domain-containing protein n=1 Tax=Streptosporangium fragile TaxID=46186 RepID=A0ABN3W6X2_9ACTN